MAENTLHISGTTFDLLVVLLILVICSSLLTSGLLLLRRRRTTRHTDSSVEDDEETLPAYSEKRISSASSHSHHRRGTARLTTSYRFDSEKEALVGEPSSPAEPVPEIRVTFPEEVDAAGKRTSGKVVVVRVGDTSIGLEPVSEAEPLCRQGTSERFHSIDLERVGGLVEDKRRTVSARY